MDRFLGIGNGRGARRRDPFSTRNSIPSGRGTVMRYTPPPPDPKPLLAVLARETPPRAPRVPPSGLTLALTPCTRRAPRPAVALAPVAAATHHHHHTAARTVVTPVTLLLLATAHDPRHEGLDDAPGSADTSSGPRPTPSAGSRDRCFKRHPGFGLDLVAGAFLISPPPRSIVLSERTRATRFANGLEGTRASPRTLDRPPPPPPLPELPNPDWR